jgi:low affinity Fe/Cu permease
VFGVCPRLVTISQTIAAATTLAMVFVIQQRQARAHAATQRKLDEILLASPDADNTLITLEEAPDNELKTATDAHRDARRDANQESPSGEAPFARGPFRSSGRMGRILSPVHAAHLDGGRPTGSKNFRAPARSGTSRHTRSLPVSQLRTSMRRGAH